MQMLARHNRDALIELLGERLEFERASVDLYDDVLAKLRASRDEAARRFTPTLVEHRNDESEHAEWLAASIDALGGSTTVRSERVELVLRESRGIREVVHDDESLSHLLHALFAAELLDNAGWDLLVELADEANDIEALRDFEKRKNDEEEHLVFVRDALAAIARRDVLGDESRIVAQGP
jgi:bacterioferritin (cytochrome b1)